MLQVFLFFFFFFQIEIRNLFKEIVDKVIGLVSYFSLYAYELLDKRKIEVVYIITKLM